MNDASKCERCGTDKERFALVDGLHRVYRCPLPGPACQSIAELKSKCEALTKRNEELEQLVILAESAHNDDIAMRAEVRGFISDLYAERGQDGRVAHLCNRALALLKP